MKRLVRFSAAVASSAFLVAGVAGVAAASPAITGNANNSVNRVRQTAHVESDTNNSASVTATNNTPQTSKSGKVQVHDNRTAGDVASGNTNVTSSLKGTVNVDYTNSNTPATGGAGAEDLSGTASPTISDNGNSSVNTVRQSANVLTTVDNSSSTTLTNNNSQTSTSGNVKVHDNRTVGNVTSGNATASSTTDFTVNVTY